MTSTGCNKLYMCKLIFLTTKKKGYFIYFKAELVSQHTLFAMLWKEYALSDSRYLTGDLFTLCIETITVVCSLSLLFPPLA